MFEGNIVDEHLQNAEISSSGVARTSSKGSNSHSRSHESERDKRNKSIMYEGD